MIKSLCFPREVNFVVCNFGRSPAWPFDFFSANNTFLACILSKTWRQQVDVMALIVDLVVSVIEAENGTGTRLPMPVLKLLNANETLAPFTESGLNVVFVVREGIAISIFTDHGNCKPRLSRNVGHRKYEECTRRYFASRVLSIEASMYPKVPATVIWKRASHNNLLCRIRVQMWRHGPVVASDAQGKKDKQRQQAMFSERLHRFYLGGRRELPTWSSAACAAYRASTQIIGPSNNPREICNALILCDTPMT